MDKATAPKSRKWNDSSVIALFGVILLTIGIGAYDYRLALLFNGVSLLLVAFALETINVKMSAVKK